MHHPVSNMSMYSRVSSLIFVLLASSLWAQQANPNKAEDAAIRQVKTVDISSLDRGLPKVTLDFFLKYEGEGAPIKWRTVKCDLLNGNSSVDRGLLCVEADIVLKDDRSATIVVSVGTLKTGLACTPTLASVTITDATGMVHAVRLSDLPMQLHRPPPKSPRDMPFPAGAALSPFAVGWIPKRVNERS